MRGGGGLKKAEKLTAPARKMLCDAFDIAAELGAPFVDGSHLLLAVAADEGSPAAKLLAEYGFTEQSLSEPITAYAANGTSGQTPVLGFSESGRRIIARAALEAAKSGRASVAAEHILAGVLGERGCSAAGLLKSCGTDPSELAEELFGGARG